MAGSRRRPRLLSASLVALALVCGCGTGRVNLWPVYFRETRIVPGEDGPDTITETDVFYPLFSRHESPESAWHAVRPLYNFERQKDTGHWRVQYLWPFGLCGSRGKDASYNRFVFLYSHKKVWSQPAQKYSTHGFIFPLVWWGNHAEFGRYFALFPLGGVTHGVLGRTWGFALFPLYSYYRRGDFVRNDFLWPILSWGRSPDGKQKMWRFWPLYVYQRYEDAMVFRTTTDLLWPLIRWGHMDRGGTRYFTMFKFAPFTSWVSTYDRAGRLISRRLKVVGVAGWPGGWSALWGLIGDKSAAKSDEMRVFPFYWRTTRYLSGRGDPERRATLYRVPWPLVWVGRNRLDPGRYCDLIVVAPLYWHYTETYPRADEPPARRRRITLFPLFTWGHDVAGGGGFWMPSHGWQDLTTGFKRNYRPFFDLFAYRKTGLEERETRLLSRLYHHRRGPCGRYLSVASLFTWDSTGEVPGEDGTYFSVLLGLVKCSWDDEGSRWRILYIPFGRSGRQSAGE